MILNDKMIKEKCTVTTVYNKRPTNNLSSKEN